ncbi:VWD domain-containing protein [Roseinatronobacter sp. NSM]|uniref:VWD domain-containing protein n=1 Tax=Roseinatronobacter sp. NSM TaxID=3457785 RepID=UPI004036F1A6
MTTISLNRNFQTLLDGLGDTRLADFNFGNIDLLDNFTTEDAYFASNPVLTSTSFTAQFNSLDESDPTLYTLRVQGSGITPSGTAQEFSTALDNGTANGTITQISIDYGAQRVAQLDIAPGSLTLTSGTQSLELTGGFPVTLSNIINLVDILDGEGEGSLAQYGFTGLTLRDGGAVLASLQTGDTLTLNLDGYTLTMTDADITSEQIFNFLNPGRGQILPQITLFDSNGTVVNGHTFGFSNDSPSSFRIAYEHLPQGTYYAQITASDQQIVDWQTQTGLYQLYSSWWAGVNSGVSSSEDMGDAPANASTPYVLNSGAIFFGAVGSVGDADWVRIDFPEWSSTYRQYDMFSGESVEFTDALVLQAFGTGQPEPQLRDLPGLNFGGLTVSAPDGTVIVSAENVESFAAFMDELDTILASMRLPQIGGLGLAFATGDPHLLTHDGLGYDFHAAGEYVLMRATNGADFELQSRMSPAGENVTANVAAALRLGDDVIMIAPGATPLLLNGVAQPLADGGVLVRANGSIERDGNSYKISITAPDMSTSLVQVDIVGSRVDIGVGLSDYWQNNVEGLLGNFSGSIQDDLRLANGTSLTFPLVFGDDEAAGTYGVYGQFREDWRVNDTTTLFTYGEGEGPDSFYLADYPTQMTTLDDFTTEERAGAEAAAEAAGLTPGTFAFNNAVLDLLITQDDSYLDSAVNANNVLIDMGATPDNIHVPQVAGGGITEGLLGLSGRVTDLDGTGLSNATVTFRPAGTSVNLTRLTRDGDDFRFDLSENATGRLDASRDWQTGDPAITALDALDVLRLAVGLNPSFGPAQAQNFIAADVNGDGAVTALDALEVLRAAVGLQSATPPRWVFFDADTDFEAMSLSRTNTHVETGIDIAALNSSLAGIDMVGILLGNMDSVA